MPATASPRHPWKALAVVLLVFAAVHGAGAHVPFGDHASPHIRIVHADHDCAGVHIDVDDRDEDRDDDAPDLDAVFDVFDDVDWS
jgi:hypothetical protein